MADIVCRIAESNDELMQAFAVRRQVFVDEQALFQATDRDAYDERAVHLVALSRGKVVGTVRIYQHKDKAWWGGRLAILKRYRGRAGRMLVHKAMTIVRLNKAEHFFAYVQINNVAFFKSLHWKVAGEAFLHHGRQHVLMEADFKTPGAEKSGKSRTAAGKQQRAESRE